VFKLDCIFISDVHGKLNRLKKFFEICEKEKPNMVFIGGDILPNQFAFKSSIDDFLKKEFFLKIKKISKISGEKTRFILILGNDDPRVFEKIFLDADKKGLINYVHNKTIKFNRFFVSGYAYVPPTPFQLKDWEKYDVSRFVDVGVVSPENGIRTIVINEDKIRLSTISEDLEILSENAPVEKTIFLFHSPPYNSYLDRAEVDGQKVDHAPLDVHVGSIAIQRFIENKQPMLTLHGHVHESAKITGHWKQKFGRTYSFSAAHDGPELALIRFDTNDLENASREIIDVD
jgi:Icc-related predicted phosphoesterase